MGSLTSDIRYPDASDPSLVLTHPTAAEKEQTWRLNHREWGGPLNLPAYMGRERHLASTEVAADDGMLHWILTDASADQSEKRNVLASCETIRKRVLYVPPASNEVKEGLGYGIGSVYTYPEFRGKKYAARMLRDLGEALKTWPDEQQLAKKRAHVRGPDHVNGSRATNGTAAAESTPRPEAVCSALWSDIGKRFYAAKGWPAFASGHVEFPSSSPSSMAALLEQCAQQPRETALALAPVTTHNIARLCRADEAQLRRALVQSAHDSGRTAFAFAPEPDVFRWHWAREAFVASHVFPGRAASAVKGVVATVTARPGAEDANGEDARGDSGGKTRMWAVWTRNYGADAAANPAQNTLYILRLVIENSDYNPDNDTDADPKALQLAFDAILHSALDAARAWNCGAVHLWNPSAAVRALVAGSGLAHRFVDREVDSIPSVMWHGPEGEGERADGVEWVANEKYCWC